jgi:hypothetical protein
MFKEENLINWSAKTGRKKRRTNTIEGNYDGNEKIKFSKSQLTNTRPFLLKACLLCV